MGIRCSIAEVGTLCLVLGSTTSVAALNPSCREPNVLILFDISGSMGVAHHDPPSKYDQAQLAIHHVTQNSQGAIRYGLEVFPTPGTAPVYCTISSTLAVELALYNWQAIYNYLSPTLYGSSSPNPLFFGGPRADYDTPMYQALDNARTLPELLDGTRRNYLLLITDGVQDCCRGGDYDDDLDCNPAEPYGSADYFVPAEKEQNRADLINLVTAIYGQGISTFVVGFGSGVDADTLTSLAIAGGTAPEGCESTSSCYYQAADQTQLQTALNQIVASVRDEVCDGLDNGCDGVVDEYCDCLEGQTRACGYSLGTCQTGHQECHDGLWSDCIDSVDPGIELCDNLDNDCNGAIDDNALCGGTSVCRCGSCVGPCQTVADCPARARCLAGYCILDQCPSGSYCDGTVCREGDRPYTPDDGSSPVVSGSPANGCDCASSGLGVATPLSASGALLAAWLLLRRRLRSQSR